MGPAASAPAPGTGTCLYARILGSAWETLPPAIRQMHSPPLQAHGRFSVRRGRGMGWLLGWLMRLPAPGDVAVELTVEPERDGERWRRCMDGSRLDTTQTIGPHGTLVERFGLLEFQFRLNCSTGTLEYEQVLVSAVCGPTRLPLPKWLAPHVAAREVALTDSAGTRVAVEVRSPTMGLLVAYEGEIRRTGVA